MDGWTTTRSWNRKDTRRGRPSKSTKGRRAQSRKRRFKGRSLCQRGAKPGWPRSGATPSHLSPAIKGSESRLESQCEHGSRAGVWHILRLFAQRNWKFTCYAVGHAVELNPEPVKDMADQEQV
ncbi:hypothetical protein BC830DRAFT_1111422 [Chytriomyces sp. MP71]|nr:hypothetical protein BC830DRAFT_1111422 [Chytriomyces sp. MP71]